MYGNGDVWVNLTDHGYKVQAINLPTPRTPKEPPVGSVRFTCDAERHRAVIDIGSNGAPRYRAWNKPHSLTQKPDTELAQGTETFEGTGQCAYRVWTFRSGGVRFVAEELGCGGEVPPPVGATGHLEISGGDKAENREWCF